MENKYAVTSRTDGIVSYILESLRSARMWSKCGDTLYISFEELRELYFSPGGAYMLKNSLIIEDPKIRFEILGEDTEMEYEYTEKDVKRLLYEDSDDALADCLDYAPDGVLNLIRSNVIKKLPNTTKKLEMLNEKFDTDFQQIFNMMKDDEPVAVEDSKPARRVQQKSNKYKVVGE